MEDANTTPADPNVTEYAKSFNLPKEAVETKGTEERPQELQSIKNKLYEYRKKQTDIIKQQAENKKSAVETTPVLTKEEAEKKVEAEPNLDAKKYDNLDTPTNNKEINPVNRSINQVDSTENNVNDLYNKNKETTNRESIKSLDSGQQDVEPIKQVEVQKIVETSNSPQDVSKKIELPDISNLDERLKRETAALPEPPNPNIPDTTVISENNAPKKQESNITATSNEVLPPFTTKDVGITQDIPVVSSELPVQSKSAPTLPESSTTNTTANELVTNQPAIEPRSTEPIAIEKQEAVTEQPIISDSKKINEEVAQEIPPPEIPTPEQPDFAELYTKNLQTIIDNFAASISQTSNPAENSLNSIQTVIESLARESTSSTKQMAGMINRLCTAVEGILRYLPNMNIQSGGASVMPQLSQTYKDINTGLIDDTRSDFRKQYGGGIIDMANKRPTMPGFSI